MSGIKSCSNNHTRHAEYVNCPSAGLSEQDSRYERDRNTNNRESRKRLTIENQPDCYKKWIQCIKHLRDAGIQLAQSHIIKKRSDSVYAPCYNTSKQT